jgi:single-stranded-DNA-specific exonuclease
VVQGDQVDLVEQVGLRRARQTGAPTPGSGRSGSRDGHQSGSQPNIDVAVEDLLAAFARDFRVARELPPADLNAIPARTALQVQLLYNRGVRGASAVSAWLERDWRDGGPALPGMAEAVARIRKAVARGERIVVFGDYDTDGITSCAVVLLTLRALGAQAEPYIPRRDDAGRGPTQPALRELRERGTSLVITTDGGTTNADEIAFATTLGLDVIVTDHHAPHGPLAPAYALVNPRLADPPLPDADLAGVGVAFRLAESLLASAPDGSDAPVAPSQKAALLESLLDLVVVGTIADVVPLTGANWALARAGLARLNTQPRPGLRALLAQAGLALGAVREDDIGFRLAPRLNAGQRMGEPALALELLLATDEREARALATRLHELNAQRRRLTDELVGEAHRQIRSQKQAQNVARFPAPLQGATDGTALDDTLIAVIGNRWPLGMLGLVASRLTDELGCPTVAISRDGDVCRGSLRAPNAPDDGPNLVEALGARAELLRYFGGHAHAAGFTVATADLDALLAHLRLALVRTTEASGSVPARRDRLIADCRLPLNRARTEKVAEIREIGPFGPGFATPLFVCRGVRIMRCWAGGPERRHLRLVVRDATAERHASWLGMGGYAVALRRHLAALPPLDMLYTLVPYYIAPDRGPEYVSVVALNPAEERL